MRVDPQGIHARLALELFDRARISRLGCPPSFGRDLDPEVVRVMKAGRSALWCDNAQTLPSRLSNLHLMRMLHGMQFEIYT
jgi:hypothetical protein